MQWLQGTQWAQSGRERSQLPFALRRVGAHYRVRPSPFKKSTQLTRRGHRQKYFVFRESVAPSVDRGILISMVLTPEAGLRGPASKGACVARASSMRAGVQRSSGSRTIHGHQAKKNAVSAPRARGNRIFLRPGAAAVAIEGHSIQGFGPASFGTCGWTEVDFDRDVRRPTGVNRGTLTPKSGRRVIPNPNCDAHIVKASAKILGRRWPHAQGHRGASPA